MELHIKPTFAVNATDQTPRYACSVLSNVLPYSASLYEYTRHELYVFLFPLFSAAPSISSPSQALSFLLFPHSSAGGSSHTLSDPSFCSLHPICFSTRLSSPFLSHLAFPFSSSPLPFSLPLLCSALLPSPHHSPLVHRLYDLLRSYCWQLISS